MRAHVRCLTHPVSGHPGGSTSPSLHFLEQPPVDPGTVWKQPKVRGDEESGSIQVRGEGEPGAVQVQSRAEVMRNQVQSGLKMNKHVCC